MQLPEELRSAISHLMANSYLIAHYCLLSVSMTLSLLRISVDFYIFIFFAGI